MRTSALRDLLVETPALSQLGRKLVPSFVRERLKRRWRIGERPRLSPEGRMRLIRIFDEDLAILGSWLGVGLDCENFDRVTRCGALRLDGWAGTDPPAE
jgi:hypothetical protein